MSDNDPREPDVAWTPEVVPAEEPRTRTSRMLEILLWIALVGIVAAVAIPELAGKPIRDENIVGTLLGFLGIPFLIARMRRASRPWLYSLAGLLLFVALPMAGGAMKGHERLAEEKELFAAIEAFEPETARRARAAEKDPALLNTIIKPALFRAAQRAPDTALVAYSDSIFQLVETPTGINRKLCIAMASGSTRNAATSADEMHMARASVQLLRAAAANPQPIAVDAERAVALRDEAMDAADVDGVTTDAAKLAAMTPDQRCDFYLRMMKLMRRLPEKDFALIMRFGMTPPR